VSPLDLIGPLSVLRDVKLGSPYRTVAVGGRTEPLATDTPLRMIPASSYREVPAPYAVIVPGGPNAVEAMRDPALLAYLRAAAETAQLVGSTAMVDFIGPLQFWPGGPAWQHCRAPDGNLHELVGSPLEASGQGRLPDRTRRWPMRVTRSVR
jgi:hypothetical protein